ncbi:MFS transporter [Frankia sp. CcI49]|uniref:MFS transporter n=1 Tax=Frankia sp. CcI49 TaxID=1745382 RepID=UPI000977E92E|nr:MFS transporter [Frankia sp. CcI49]ONH61034.1 MFS transporter [Frankia sp. CcI49]
MTWQHVTWAASVATVTALLAVCGFLLTAASGRRAEATSGAAAAGTPAAAIGVLSIVVALVTAELVFNDLIDPPAWARAVWALLTATAAGWLALHGRGLTRPVTPRPVTAGPEPAATAPAIPADPAASADPAVSASGTSADEGRPLDPLSAQDDLVQTLVVASYALQMGDEPRARQALDGALRRSRATLDELVRQRGCHGFVRATPAAVAPTTVGRDLSPLS